jgi:hypothetical protein
VLDGSEIIKPKSMKASNRRRARTRGDHSMLELKHDARFTCEGGDVAVITSARDGGRPEDKSHGVHAKVAKTIVPKGDVN